MTPFLQDHPYALVFGGLVAFDVIAVIATFAATKRRWTLPWVVTFLAAALWWLDDWTAAVFAADRYLRGDARLVAGSIRYPSNPDQDTRLSTSPQGCLGFPGRASYNATLLWMARRLGPPPGTWLGPYPSDGEALALLATRGTPIVRSDLAKPGALAAGGRALSVPAWLSDADGWDGEASTDTLLWTPLSEDSVVIGTTTEAELWTVGADFALSHFATFSTEHPRTRGTGDP